MKPDLLTEIKEILPDSSRATADYAVNLVLQKTELMSVFVSAATTLNYPWSMRASNVVEKASAKNHGLILPFLETLMHYLSVPNDQSSQRCLLKIFSHKDIICREEVHDILLDYAFNTLNNNSLPIAVRNYCIDILNQLIHFYPEIIDEYRLTLLFMAENEENALRFKALKSLKKLH